MGKDGGWKKYFHDNCRCADLINGVGCNGEQIVKATDLQDADPTSNKRSRDALRKVALGTNFVIVGIENQEEMDEDAFDVVTKYTNSKELVQAKDYSV